MTPESVTLVLPLPHKSLSPNKQPATKGGRIQKARETKKLRAASCKAARDAQIDTAPWECALAQAVFFHKVNRRRDPDNAMGSLKAAYDGLVDAHLIVDDDWRHLKRDEPTFEIDRDWPRVELTITRQIVKMNAPQIVNPGGEGFIPLDLGAGS